MLDTLVECVRTYVSPIGYDTRRVTRPVIHTGLGPEDVVIMLRPKTESDTEQATQAVADVEQLLHEIEPRVTCTVERISVDTFESTLRECCQALVDVDEDHELIVSLGGGPRDVLLPMTIATAAFTASIDRTLFFSDLDGTVRNWTIPDLTAQVPDRTADTFEVIAKDGDWLQLSAIATKTGQSKSTVIRHVNDLEDVGIIEADTTGKAKRVRIGFSGELLSLIQITDNQ